MTTELESHPNTLHIAYDSIKHPTDLSEKEVRLSV